MITSRRTTTMTITWAIYAVLLLTIAGAAPRTALAATINVPGDSQSITAAIGAAADGDTVIVAPGVYYENPVIEKDIVLASRFLATGDTSFVAETIIDGGKKSSVLALNPEFTRENIVVGLTGVTLTNGGGYESPMGDSGGGIYCTNTTLTIRNCRIADNRIEEGMDSGLHAIQSSVRISDTVFADNYSAVSYQSNGCCTLSSSNATLSNVAFLNNGTVGSLRLGNSTVQADSILIDETEWSRALHVAGSSDLELNDSTIRSCGRGVLKLREGSTATFNRCLVHDIVKSDNDVIGVFKDCTLKVFNSTFLNITYAIGPPVQITSNSTAYFINSILWNGESPEFDMISTRESTLVVDHSDIQGGFEDIHTDDPDSVFWLDGNIDADPLLDDDFRLTESSPCVNAGTASFSWNGSEMLNMSSSGYHDIAPDIGAFKSDFVTSVGNEIRPRMTVFPPFPNPFNGSAVIRFSLPRGTHATITVYSVTGQKVATLADTYLAAGAHAVRFGGENLAAGMYICSIEAGGHVTTVKMSLVK